EAQGDARYAIGLAGPLARQPGGGFFQASLRGVNGYRVPESIPANTGRRSQSVRRAIGERESVQGYADATGDRAARRQDLANGDGAEVGPTALCIRVFATRDVPLCLLKGVGRPEHRPVSLGAVR